MNNASEAQFAVEACKYPPIGERGLAGGRWNEWNLGGEGLEAAVRRANERTVVGVQIETLEGVRNAARRAQRGPSCY